MQKYYLKCVNCKKEYGEFPLSLQIGPLGHEVVTGQEEGHAADGGDLNIITYSTKPLYQGGKLEVNCPSCLLRLCIAKDLAPFTMLEWLRIQQDELKDIKIENIFDKRGRLRDFPLNCPRCDERIQSPNMSKACKHCGSKQLNLVRTHYSIDWSPI